jgi:hypothetical protein
VTFTGTTAGTSAGSSNAALIDILRNNTTSAVNGATVVTWNPRGIVFIQPSLAKDQDNPRSGIKNSTGLWYDSLGLPYNVAIDGNYNNVVVAPAYTDLAANYTTASNGDVGVTRGIIAWSFGHDGTIGNNGDGIYKNTTTGIQSDDMISWQ